MKRVELIFNTALLCLAGVSWPAQVSSQAPPELSTGQQHHPDSVSQTIQTLEAGVMSELAVLEVNDDLLIDLGPGGVDLNEKAIARAFYERFPDSFDHLVVWTNFSVALAGVGAAGLYIPVSSEVTGLNIGMSGRLPEVFDQTAEFGSQGHLKGMILMGNVDEMPSNPKNTRYNNGFSVLDVLAQETAHQFGAFVSYRTADGELRDDMIGRSGAHWSFFFHSGGSVLEGNNWEAWEDSSYTSGQFGGRLSHLDQYLMGLRLPSQVTERYFVFPEPESIKPTGAGAFWGPMEGAEVTGERQEVTIAMIEDAHGPRRPDARASSKAFRQAFILLTRGAYEEEEAWLEQTRRMWAREFHTKVEGRGRVVTTLDGEDDMPRWNFSTSNEGWHVEGGTARSGVDVGALEIVPSATTVSISNGNLAINASRVVYWTVTLKVSSQGDTQAPCALAASLQWDGVDGASEISTFDVAVDDSVHSYTVETPPALQDVSQLTLTLDLPAQSRKEAYAITLTGVEGEEVSSFADRDQDGIEDSVDNCVSVGNPIQTDEDSDGVGDACVAGQAVCTLFRPERTAAGCGCSQGVHPRREQGILMVLLVTLMSLFWR